MTEDEYINLVNRERMWQAVAILRDVIPNDNCKEAEMTAIKSQLMDIADNCAKQIEID